jgi:hypothetical protein
VESDRSPAIGVEIAGFLVTEQAVIKNKNVKK